VTFAIDPGTIRVTFENAVARLRANRFTEALWQRRLDVWTADAAVQQQIGSRLGWLDAAGSMEAHVPRLRRRADDAKRAFSDVVLLGMGGSSLAPEVIRTVIGVADGYPRFHVLDSIDPDAVRNTMDRPATTLFVVASKSGSTIEVAALVAEAERVVHAAGVAVHGSRFIAITDEGTPLHRYAVKNRFRDVFLNPADIGGRYSALSLFGLVPAALMGADIDGLLTSARAMADVCRADDPDHNPGLMLGAMMAAAARAGRDKLVLLLPERLEALGLWIEQLVAESTGKQGKGIVPVPAQQNEVSEGDDRLLVSVDISDVTELGGEFFRWEMATATAGYLLDVNPFDEPNVQQAKDATRILLATYSGEARLPMPQPHASSAGAFLTFTQPALHTMTGATLPAFFELIQPRDYFALLAYIRPDDDTLAATLRRVGITGAARRGCVTTFGYGPRYLHSTGQLHKGGPNTGVFLIVTATPDSDRPVPGELYSFGVLEMAQAVGDFLTLDNAGRRGVHLHLPTRDPDLLSRIFQGC
jgi:glucose-6-phosphate isomerase